MSARPTHWTRRLLVVAAAAAAALLAAGAPATGAAIARSHTVHQTTDDENWVCGYRLSVHSTTTELLTFMLDPGLPDTVRIFDQYSIKSVWTADDGRSFTVQSQGVFKDLNPKHVSGDIYRFTTIQAGQPYVITDSSGRTVWRDRGQIRFSATYDVVTGEPVGFSLDVAGPHPLFYLDICKAVAPLTGTGSARYLTARPLGSTSSAMGYYEYLPPSYSATGAKSPLLVATNGYGENGDGTPEAITNLLFTGIPRFLDVGGWPTDRPLVVLATQHVEDPPGFDFSSCEGAQWPGSCLMQLQHERGNVQPAGCTTPGEIHDFIAYAVAHYNVDPDRVYLTGLSCGAYGTWEYLSQHGTSQVAAAVPVAGDGRPALGTVGCALAAAPVWAIHGELDDVVDPRGSTETIGALRACPGVTADRARLSVYEGLFHDGWDQAYSGSLGDDVYTWMLSFRRP